jgi:hypothetical protein
MATDRRQLLATIAGAFTTLSAARCGGSRPETSPQVAEPSAKETEAYKSAYAKMLDKKSLDKVARQLGAMEVVLVPGFLAQIIQEVGLPVCGVGPNQYFRRQSEWLGKQSIVNRYLDLEPDAVQVNAIKVAGTIEDAKSKIVLVTHSKGCLDSLSALVDHAALRTKVAAWVAIQGPFRGAPMADVIAEPGIAGVTADAALELLGGSGAALEDMRSERRLAYHRDNATKVAAVLRKTPTICYGSYMVKQTCLSPLNQIGKLAGAPKNDGLVSPDSALLKGALRVVEADVDHGMPVLGTDNNALDPVRCLAALLSVRFAGS